MSISRNIHIILLLSLLLPTGMVVHANGFGGLVRGDAGPSRSEQSSHEAGSAGGGETDRPSLAGELAETAKDRLGDCIEGGVVGGILGGLAGKPREGFAAGCLGGWVAGGYRETRELLSPSTEECTLVSGTKRFWTLGRKTAARTP